MANFNREEKRRNGEHFRQIAERLEEYGVKTESLGGMQFSIRTCHGLCLTVRPHILQIEKDDLIHSCMNAANFEQRLTHAATYGELSVK